MRCALGKTYGKRAICYNAAMKYRKLPTTDIDVSVICMGTMNFGQQVAESDAHEQLDYAVSEGVNFIDTAEIYPIPPEKHLQGTTETFVGNWLHKQKRDDLIVATKVASSELIQTREFDGKQTRYDRKNILRAIDDSLMRLKTDYVDLYQVHWAERKVNDFGVRGVESLVDEETTSIEETLSVLGDVVKSGKVRYIGVSNETPWGVMEYLRVAEEKNLPRIVTIQNQYSLTNRTFEIGLSEMCLRENIGLLAYSTVNGGVLSGKYLGGAKPEGARFTLTERNKARYNAAHLQAATERYVSIAKKHGLDPVQMALAFVNDRAFTTSTIIGATTMDQLKADIASIDVTLAEEVMADIRQAYRELPDPSC